MAHRAAVVVVVAVWLKLFGFKRIYSRAHGPARCSCWFERVRFNCTYARAHGPARWCCCCVYFWLKPFRFTCIYARAHGPARCCCWFTRSRLKCIYARARANPWPSAPFLPHACVLCNASARTNQKTETILRHARVRLWHVVASRACLNWRSCAPATNAIEFVMIGICIVIPPSPHTIGTFFLDKTMFTSTLSGVV